MDTIGKRFKFLRQQKDLSMAELSNQLNADISAPSISNIENDKQDPNTATVIAYSQFFNVSTDWLLTGKEFTNIQTKYIDMFDIHRTKGTSLAQPKLLVVMSEMMQILKKDPLYFEQVINELSKPSAADTTDDEKNDN